MSEHFSHYTIIEPIGAGGMGEVYRARDTQLDRDVALKILPEAFTADPERLARFEREAKLLASLNHPNIGAIYAIARESSRIGLALELVEGEDLAALISRGAVPIADTLDIARQVSLALEYAHDQGVIHRDLKPANIKITPDGTVKVLDFGLAKAVDTTQSELSDPSITQSPTMVGSSTQAGMIMGTAAYMSPEQARGKPLDRRTDIFSFGIVVFEMLTGSRPFDGETISDTLASILAREADLSKLPANTPPALRLIVERCLEKDAKRRMRDIGEARLIIEAVRGGDNTASAILGAAPDDGAPLQKESKHRPREIIAWAVAITAAAMAAFFATRPGQAPPPTTASLLSVPIDGGNDVRFSYNGLALSPDGARVAYANNGKLYIRALDAWDPIEISNSEGASTPFWSPDGKWLAFAIEKTIWKVRPDGTQRTRVGEAEEDFTRTTGGAWMANGQLVFRGQRDLFAMPASGGDAAMFVSGEDTALVDFHQPEALPGGAGIIVVVHTQEGVNSIGLVSPDGTLEIVAKIDGGELGDPVYSPSGHILYTIKGDLWALPFDLDARKVTGEPVVIARNAAVPTVSSDGTLAFIRGIGRALRQLVLVDRTGQIVTRFGQPSDLWAICALSPDGRRAAGQDGEDQDIYLHDDRGARVRATFTNMEHDMISFSADGEVVYFSTGTQASYRIGSKTIDSNEPETVIVEAGEIGPHYFGSTPFATRDRKILFYSAKGPNNKQDVAWVDLTRKSEPQRFLSSPAAEYGAIPSPADYTYIAYVSDESGRAQIYLTTFPGAERKVPVSIDGGVWPRWKRDGSELYFANGNDILAVSVSYDPLSVGKPQKLFSRPDNDDRQPFGWPPTFDVTADGERFLVMDPVVSEETQPSIAIIPGWAATMR